jgi:cation:H+ antiporter
MKAWEVFLTVYLILAIGFILLIKGADILVEGASSLARKFNVTDLVIGLTIVAFGTSAPELFVNVISSIKGNSAIAIGNVMGSNVANILLGLGFASLVRPLEVGKGTVWKELPFLLLASLLLGFLANDMLFFKSSFSFIGRIDGVIFLIFFAGFMIYSFCIAGSSDIPEPIPGKSFTAFRSVVFILLGLAGLGLGGKLIVESAVEIAGKLGMDEILVGLTVVAIGTSLPEIVTSIVAARKGKMGIAVGNIVGSNIFNILLVLGISAGIKPVPFYPDENVSMLMVVFTSFILFITMFAGKKNKLDKWEGMVFLFLYSGYLGYLLFNR